jgi:hypothetical protein
MRIIDMRPEITPWKDGTDRKVGNWSYRDSYQSIGGHVREIFHYTTPMVEFVGFEREFDKTRGEVTLEWQVTFVGIGHGSVSDQGGINQLLGLTSIWRNGHQRYESYGYRMQRDQRGGGPRIINTITNEVEVD